MVAPQESIRMPQAEAGAFLRGQGFRQVRGHWFSSTRWARVIPLTGGRVSVQIGVVV